MHKLLFLCLPNAVYKSVELSVDLEMALTVMIVNVTEILNVAAQR